MSFIGDASGDWVSGGDLVDGQDITPAGAAGFDFGGFVSNAADGLLNVAKSVIDLRSAKETAAYRRQQNERANALELAKVNGAIEVEKLRTAGAINQQRALLGDSGLLSMFYRPGATVASGGGSSGDWVMFALAGAGVYFAWKAVK